MDTIKSAKSYTGANEEITLEVVGLLSGGELAKCVENYLTEIANVRANLTWDNVKNEITCLFMSEDGQQMSSR